MTVISKTRLRILDPHELLNQIAGTYKDFFRAAMEYIDNAVDAASINKEKGEKIDAHLNINVDVVDKKVTFTDNCGGMSADELCDLISKVGRSKKKLVPWANGQFGFGVHAFRAFAKEAIFISKKKMFKEAKIKIDRECNEETEVSCEETSKMQLVYPGTRVIISKFDRQVFKKQFFMRGLIGEIERHFDDVLRSKMIKIVVSDGKIKHECKSFDYASLPGISLKEEIPVDCDGRKNKLNIDLRILDQSQENRLPVLTNKQRRIQSIIDLKSYKNYVREKGKNISVWANPFVTGSIEINDITSPNLTRDDLKDTPTREILYEKIFEIQVKLETQIDKLMNKKSQDAFNKLSKVMSDCLSRIMRGFRLQYEQLSPSSVPGQFETKIIEDNGDIPFGNGEIGGGGIDQNRLNIGGERSNFDKSGVGDEPKGGGDGDLEKGKGQGLSKEQLLQASGPRILFQNHAGDDRIIDLGNSLVINTQHPDFIKRNLSKSGKIKLDNRLISYVSVIVAPPCIHKLFEKKGKVPSTLEAGANIIDLGLKLEQELSSTMLDEEIEKTLD